MVITSLFWMIIGLGIAVPSTLLLIFNLFTKAIAGENYQLSLQKVASLYLIALVGWGILFGIQGG